MEPAAAPPEPTQQLPSEARGYLVAQGLGRSVPVAIAAVWGGTALEAGGAPNGIGAALIALALAGVLVAGVLVPLLRFRNWRYEVRDYEIDLLRGALVVTRTLVPMTRVQHVDTRRTVLSQAFDLRSVIVHSAAGAQEIPALRPGEAARLRDHIALLAREPDEL